MLTLQSLCKSYAGQKAVDHVSLEILTGSIFGLLGPNGAGKSSLLRMITGITMPDEGKILFDGQRFDPLKHSRRIGYMPEERGLYKKMKVEEQTLYLARLKGMDLAEARREAKHWFDKLGMDSWRNRKVEDLSKGMSQKLQFVITVLHKPDLLILDEPFSGLDPVNSEVIKQEILELARKGTTVIFSTHRMEQVEELCREIGLIDRGQLILEGHVDEIRERFKEHRYELQVHPEPAELSPWIVERRGSSLILQFREPEDAATVLRVCLNKGAEVKLFREILPRLHEIFIRLVEKTAARNFSLS